jgi:hypothetical protein
MNPQPLNRYSLAVADAVGTVLDEDEFPAVIGGGCSILLGTMLALRRRGPDLPRGPRLRSHGHGRRLVGNDPQAVTDRIRARNGFHAERRIGARVESARASNWLDTMVLPRSGGHLVSVLPEKGVPDGKTVEVSGGIPPGGGAAGVGL